MNLDNSTPADSGAEPELDALVLVLHEELALLGRLHLRLTVLRLLLLDGNPRFIQAAATDVEAETKCLVEHESRTIGAITAARNALNRTTGRLIDLAADAPASHRKVLLRLTRELETTSRAISTLREAVRRQSESGRRAASQVLDLRTDADEHDPQEAALGQMFHGEL